MAKAIIAPEHLKLYHDCEEYYDDKITEIRSTAAKLREDYCDRRIKTDLSEIYISEIGELLKEYEDARSLCKKACDACYWLDLPEFRRAKRTQPTLTDDERETLASIVKRALPCGPEVG